MIKTKFSFRQWAALLLVAATFLVLVLCTVHAPLLLTVACAILFVILIAEVV